MTTATKLLRAMRNNPRDWVIEQLLTVTQRHGVEVRNHGGSVSGQLSHLEFPIGA